MFRLVAMARHALRILRLRGLRYLWYLPFGYALPRFVAWLAFESPIASFCNRLVSGLARRVSTSRGVLRHAARSQNFFSARAWLPAEIWEAARDRYQAFPGKPVVLGEVDNDGRVRTADWVGGSLPDLDDVGSESFDPRKRHPLELVLVFEHEKNDGVVLTRKDFQGDRTAFRHEWRSLVALAGTPWCPEIYEADEERLQLYKSFVPGPTVRQALFYAGARILSAQTEADPNLAQLDAVARIEAVWARGRKCFGVLPESFFEELEGHVNALHGWGVTGFSLTFGNVVLRQEDGPWLIDFDSAKKHRRRGLAFDVLRDRDRELLNRIYGREILTERSARRLVKRLSTPYSPFDLGRGLATRGFWSVDSGTGRWEVLNRRVMLGLIRGGGRILDLGCYNGLMPLLMLRDGAMEVVAVERSAERIEQAKDLRRLFEWRYMRSFAGLDLRCADMRAILEGEWGTYDLVTAFCSLYYLGEDEMRRMVRRAAELAPVLVVQAKTDTRRDAADAKAKKSSIEFLKSLIEGNGFPDCEVVEPAGYPRPLLIGRRSGSAATAEKRAR